MDKFVQNTRNFLKAERDAEINETRILHENVSPKLVAKKGLCVLRCQICRQHVGLFDRTILDFELDKQRHVLNMGPGDVVGLSYNKDSNLNNIICSGVVVKISSTMSVAFDDSEKISTLDDTIYYNLVKLANDVTYKKLRNALDSMEKNINHVQDVLFGESEPSPPISDLTDIKFYNESLDESQRNAVLFSLQQKEIAVVHGPPGTGKTTTLVEIIRQSVNMNMKVLVCAPSNIAVDNLVERLGVCKLKIIRLGHPARLQPSIVKYSLDAVVGSSDETRIVEDVRKEINNLMAKLYNSKRKIKNWSERTRARDELKLLRKELRTREASAIKNILDRSQIILSTLVTASSDGPLIKLTEKMFDLVVIDECSQALEAACWIPLLKAKKCVIAGDHNQLPPTIFSTGEVQKQLQISLMERLIGFYDDRVVRMLSVQYRMNRDIMLWSSEYFYKGKLSADESVSKHLLSGFDGVASNELTNASLLFIDTSGCDFEELTLPDNVSKANEGEADVVYSHLKKLINFGVRQEHIGIIVPYNLQVEILREKIKPLYPNVEIKSVDGFQGREKEVIIFSFVRSNKRGEIGFLSEYRRLNVAVTRARRHLALVGDASTLNQDAVIRGFLQYVDDVGLVLSAFEYIREPCDDAYNEDNLLELNRKHIIFSPNFENKLNLRTQNDKYSHGTDANKENSETICKLNPTEYASMREKYTTILKSFINDFNLFKTSFSSQLSSVERLIIHQLCEELNLCHVSHGLGTDRYIEVSKPSLNSNQVLDLTKNTDSRFDANAIIMNDANVIETHRVSENNIIKESINNVNASSLNNFSEQLQKLSETISNNIIRSIICIDTKSDINNIGSPSIMAMTEKIPSRDKLLEMESLNNKFDVSLSLMNNNGVRISSNENMSPNIVGNIENAKNNCVREYDLDINVNPLKENIKIQDNQQFSKKTTEVQMEVDKKYKTNWSLEIKKGLNSLVCYYCHNTYHKLNKELHMLFCNELINPRKKYSVNKNILESSIESHSSKQKQNKEKQQKIIIKNTLTEKTKLLQQNTSNLKTIDNQNKTLVLEKKGPLLFQQNEDQNMEHQNKSSFFEMTTLQPLPLQFIEQNIKPENESNLYNGNDFSKKQKVKKKKIKNQHSDSLITNKNDSSSNSSIPLSNDNFDEIIAQELKKNSVCSSFNCVEKIRVLGQRCPFCAQTFCLSHYMPEVHGCGSKAKVAARRQLARDGVLYAGSGLPNKELKPEKKAYLKGKLEKKMAELQANRKGNKMVGKEEK